VKFFDLFGFLWCEIPSFSHGSALLFVDPPASTSGQFRVQVRALGAVRERGSNVFGQELMPRSLSAIVRQKFGGPDLIVHVGLHRTGFLSGLLRRSTTFLCRAQLALSGGTIGAWRRRRVGRRTRREAPDRGEVMTAARFRPPLKINCPNDFNYLRNIHAGGRRSVWIIGTMAELRFD
jgi:hypothetical protein